MSLRPAGHAEALRVLLRGVELLHSTAPESGEQLAALLRAEQAAAAAGATRALACSQCGAAAAIASELLPERVETLSSHVYAYELDVLDTEAWCCACRRRNPSGLLLPLPLAIARRAR